VLSERALIKDDINMCRPAAENTNPKTSKQTERQKCRTASGCSTRADRVGFRDLTTLSRTAF